MNYEHLNIGKNIAKEELKKHAADLEIALTDSKITQMDRSINTVKQEVGIEGQMLVEEMGDLKSILLSEYFQNPFKIFKFLSENNRAMAFPNLFIALCTYLTIFKLKNV